MAKLETTHIFKAPIEKVFRGLGQYERYPEYLPGVTATKILPPPNKQVKCQVRYELKIIKEFYYILNMYEHAPDLIEWDLAESNLMKANKGSWKLKAIDETKTQAIYTLDVKFKGLVPRTITDKIAESSIPAMLEGFQRLIDDLE